jgi:hypothetical protein
MMAGIFLFMSFWIFDLLDCELNVCRVPPCREFYQVICIVRSPALKARSIAA